MQALAEALMAWREKRREEKSWAAGEVRVGLGSQEERSKGLSVAERGMGVRIIF